MSANGKYIVVFKKDASEADINKYADEVSQNGGTVGHKYTGSSLKGFSAEIPQSYLLQLQSLQGGIIDYIEPDQTVTIQ